MSKLESRQMERYALEVPALLSMKNQSGIPESIALMTKNISSGGAFLITDRPMPLGAAVKMDMILSIGKGSNVRETKTHIDVSGSIIRTEEHGIAVCFKKDYTISPVD